MSKNNKTEKLEGFNPAIYRTLSIVFIVLMIANIAVIMLFFSKTGFGLYHAEAALSYIAQIDINLEEINGNLLDITVHKDDQKYVEEKIRNVNAEFDAINQAAQEFRNPKFDDVDATLRTGFNEAMEKVGIYERWVRGQLSKVKADTKNYDYTTLYGLSATQKQDEATNAFDNLFKTSDTTTYAFFSKVGQSFLLIVFFLLFTMVAALVAVQWVKRRERNNALKLLESNANTFAMREKAENIAYINIISGLKNRYALDGELEGMLANKDFSIALYNFNNFNTLNESQGRQFADEFIATISGNLTDKYGDSADIYSTSINEFCVIFHNDMPKHKIEDTAWQIIDTLSRTTHIKNAQVKMTVSGCLYHYTAGEHKNPNSLFMSLDKGLNFAKQKCQFSNQSTLVPITK